MLNVTGHRVMVKPDPPKEQVRLSEELKKINFEIGMDSDTERREQVGTQIGTVVGIGHTAWQAFDKSSPDWKPWCGVGDRVIFARYAGKLVSDPVTEEEFMVLNDEDIQCVITGEKSPWE